MATQFWIDTKILGYILLTEKFIHIPSYEDDPAYRTSINKLSEILSGGLFQRSNKVLAWKDCK
jgi:hypothetical protein